MTTLGPYLLGPNSTPENGIYTGDARELANAIPDESVDLIFTDPVYDRIDDYRWLAETAARVLKPRKSVLAFCAHHRQIGAGYEMSKSGLKEGPILQHVVCGPKGRLFSHSLQCNVIPCLWYSKHLPDSKWQYIEVNTPLFGDPRMHKWGKAISMITYRLNKFTERNDTVLDVFSGGGTVPAVCKMLGRNYLAFEIDPNAAELARERVRNTQPPLFTLQPGQLELI